MTDILLGLGKEVRVPFAHTVVCGQTQASGKTTTLEGLLSRTGDPPRPALAFLTKRAESAFAQARIIPPYFRERANALTETPEGIEGSSKSFIYPLICFSSIRDLRLLNFALRVESFKGNYIHESLATSFHGEYST